MRGRWLALGLAAILLLAVGAAIGRRTAGQPPADARQAVTVTVADSAQQSRQPESQARTGTKRTGYARTPEGAVDAATAYVAALGGPAILDPAAIRRTLAVVASSASRDDLVRAYEIAAAQGRERLGVGTTSTPVVLRTTPVGYRIEGFQRRAAMVSIWRVGIVGSGATVEPRQSWRTETVSLVWEDGTWKVDAVRSSPGPTPPLAGPAATPPADLIAAIPTFDEFKDDRP